MIKNRVLLVLVAAALLAGLGLAFVAQAPNRLVSGTPIALISVLHGGVGLAVLLPAAALLVAPFLPQHRAGHAAVAVAAVSLLLALLWLAGVEARRLAEAAPRAARTSLGGAFWAIAACTGLMLNDALRRLRLPVPATAAVLAGAIGAVGLVAASGTLDDLAIMREFSARRAAVEAAVLRHVALVAAALVPTVLLGLPLGRLAQRRSAVRSTLFPVLNVVQTVPSIALFGLLIAPLSAVAGLSSRLGALGIGGVGVVPAIIALVLYSLLPVARNTAEGLAGIAPATLDAARGLGMTSRQVLWRVELPLALPVILAGLRIATVQAIGLAAVAALIGAGGLGAIMFQGLFADALDLVLVGVVPIVLLAFIADGLFGLAIAATARVPR